MRKLTIITILALLFTQAKSQIVHPVHWSYAAKRISKTEAIVLLKAIIDEGWHIYSVNQKDGGPIKTSFVFPPTKDYALTGEIKEPTPVTKFEETFNMNVKYFESSVIFQQKINLKTAHPTVKGKLSYMVCNNQKCLPPEDFDFSIPIK